jgi:hypothetical protein
MLTVIATSVKPLGGMCFSVQAVLPLIQPLGLSCSQEKPFHYNIHAFAPSDPYLSLNGGIMENTRFGTNQICYTNRNFSFCRNL